MVMITSLPRPCVWPPYEDNYNIIINSVDQSLYSLRAQYHTTMLKFRVLLPLVCHSLVLFVLFVLFVPFVLLVLFSLLRFRHAFDWCCSIS